MEPRMKHPVRVVPDAYKALAALSAAVEQAGVGKQLSELVNLRVSQINGCTVCCHMHARDLRKMGDSDERIDTVAAWRESPWFTDAERAALALAECATRLADRPDPVPDDVWDEATRHFDEKTLSGLLLSISAINVWNRLNAAVRQVPES
ncbi:carboxymuconolactone decarboxylase family protein [Actinomadura rubrisoli]|uniref:Carboxymuconolactone decarboxylase family protein n=1 Tax=Actinomadura rubrisoli TaxID=2530368 RepID=A0A4R5B6U9_9ACTN|nr:carboxymuconolactone decarboxylase family protein [Actinomadura rubrisoli]TDD80783.1 carboxymuconolactone decarboxylase family protein [Actinomadura rubrisoli]